MIKNRMILILILLCIFSYVSPVAQSSLKIWPAKLTISMPEGYSNGTIFYQIEVTNPYTYEVNASARIENPDVLQLSEGYTCIPNLTWVNISPQTLHLPANTAGYFGVSLDIPEKEKQFYYNNSWETWVVISSDGPSGELGLLL
ncbi:MAG: hypothetical protein NT038_07400 [Euryarchaeota archaeon]|nr:hypothetical protein [Euryarchaeota archaeon]